MKEEEVIEVAGAVFWGLAYLLSLTARTPSTLLSSKEKATAAKHDADMAEEHFKTRIGTLAKNEP